MRNWCPQQLGKLLSFLYNYNELKNIKSKKGDRIYLPPREIRQAQTLECSRFLH